MKRLALGTVLFLVSFSTPTSGSADLVFLTREMQQTIASVENGQGHLEVKPGNDLTLTQAAPALAAQNNAAPQQFLASQVAGQSLTQTQPGLFARQMPSWRVPQVVAAHPLPAVPEPAVWLLMVAGFALSGIALRNRRETQAEFRLRQARRLRADASLTRAAPRRTDAE